MARQISNSDEIIDSRDVTERIGELESLISDCEAAATESGDDATAENAEYDEWRAELKALKDFAEEFENYAPDFRYGEAAIRDSYFEEYAEQLADDIGAIDKRANWPLNCIDWEKAARELQQDYTSIDFDGVTYWVR